jgi:hypothetical protein
MSQNYHDLLCHEQELTLAVPTLIMSLFLIFLRIQQNIYVVLEEQQELAERDYVPYLPMVGNFPLHVK